MSGVTAAEYAVIVADVVAYMRTAEHRRRVWLMAERLRGEGW